MTITHCAYSAISRQDNGLSLLELLISIAVLSFVVSASVLLFSHARKAWSSGTNRYRSDIAARCALNMLARDLESAIADGTVSFCFRDDRFGISSYGLTNSELNVVTLSESTEGGKRAPLAVQYWVRESPRAQGTYELVRGYRHIEPDPRAPYHTANWFEDTADGGMGRPDDPATVGVVAENISLFRIATADSSNRLARLYDSVLNGSYTLPSSVDVYIELLSPETAMRAADMAGKGVDPSEYVENNSYRYVMVVSMENRNGYSPK